MKITDSHYEELLKNGYVILRNYYPEEQRRVMAVAQRRVLKTWEQVKDNPPPDRSMYVPFPSSEFSLNRAMVDHELLNLACPGGTVCVFSNYTWHSAGNYTRADGQRFTWGFAAGRVDHYWEGFKHYTDMGMNPLFQKLIGSLSAKERELFRFPPAGHPYYTPQTLAALEKQYPGWNRGGEYALA